MDNETQTAKCRYCELKLEGKPYHLGGRAFVHKADDPRRREAKSNYYGGFVCSMRCDKLVCIDMESSFPGVGPVKTISTEALRQIKRNWEEQDN